MRRNHHFRLDMSDHELLKRTLKIDRELNDAYELYHQYVRFNDTFYDDRSKVLDDLNEIINGYRISGIREFRQLADTLNNWKAEIVNSFDRYKGVRVSNGPIEGRNSLIKKILRIANGYSNFRSSGTG